MKKLLAVKDLMEVFGRSRSGVYELIGSGMKPSLYLGNSPRWTEDAITVFLAEQPTCRGRKSTVIDGGTK